MSFQKTAASLSRVGQAAPPQRMRLIEAHGGVFVDSAEQFSPDPAEDQVVIRNLNEDKQWEWRPASSIKDVGEATANPESVGVWTDQSSGLFRRKDGVPQEQEVAPINGRGEASLAHESGHGKNKAFHYGPVTGVSLEDQGNHTGVLTMERDKITHTKVKMFVRDSMVGPAYSEYNFTD